MKPPSNNQPPVMKAKPSKRSIWIIGGIIAAVVLITASQSSTPLPASQSANLQTASQSASNASDSSATDSTSSTSSDSSAINAAPATPSPQPTECTNGTYVSNDGNTVCRPEVSSTVPAGATAQCVDGTYSFSQHRSGTCSHHGGVAGWL